MKRAATWIIAAAAWIGTGFLAACHRDEPRASRVVVLGVDGLDLRLLDALVAGGALPSFAASTARAPSAR
jgi:hypothetical protein